MVPTAYVTNTTIVSAFVNGVDMMILDTKVFHENDLIVASFEAKRYEQNHLKSVMFLTIETEAIRRKMINCCHNNAFSASGSAKVPSTRKIVGGLIHREKRSKNV